MHAYLEHTNLTVRNPEQVAALFSELFGWHIRWSGGSKDDGTTYHVGSDNSYLALYTHSDLQTPAKNATPHRAINHLNHLGVVVDDVDAVEQKVIAAGYKPFNHGNYDPGRRFYFLMEDELEIEVITYDDEDKCD